MERQIRIRLFGANFLDPARPHEEWVTAAGTRGQANDAPAGGAAGGDLPAAGWRQRYAACADFHTSLGVPHMVYILDLASGGAMDPAEIQALWARYDEYLASIKDRLPPSAYAFATAPWHYSTLDHRCPHDAWVESLTISEEKNDENPIQRRMNIHVRLLGAYHDGHIELAYKGVNSYGLSKPDLGPGPWGSGGWKYIGHHDWLVDEIRLSDNNRVIHEIVFSSDARWLIECEDLIYEWQPFVAQRPGAPQAE
jgi:hypothetical protein